TRSRRREWGRRRCGCSTGRRSGWRLERHLLHLPQRRQAPERLDLDLPHALARQAEPAADLLERLRLVVGEALAEDQHLPLAPPQRGERLLERLAAERELDLLLRQRPVAGDEIPEDRVLLVADRLVEARGGAGGRADLARLLDRQAGLLGDLLERRLTSELR